MVKRIMMTLLLSSFLNVAETNAMQSSNPQTVDKIVKIIKENHFQKDSNDDKSRLQNFLEQQGIKANGSDIMEAWGQIGSEIPKDAQSVVRRKLPEIPKDAQSAVIKLPEAPNEASKEAQSVVRRKLPEIPKDAQSVVGGKLGEVTANSVLNKEDVEKKVNDIAQQKYHIDSSSLPNDMIAAILVQLNPQELVIASQVSKLWHDIALRIMEGNLRKWSKLSKEEFSKEYDRLEKPEKIVTKYLYYSNPVLNGELALLKDKEEIYFKVKDLLKADHTIDLSDPRFKEAYKYFLITTDPEEFFKHVANSERLVILIAPRFVIEEKIGSSAAPFKPIMADWKEDLVPIGMFWRMEKWENKSWYDCSTLTNPPTYRKPYDKFIQVREPSFKEVEHHPSWRDERDKGRTGDEDFDYTSSSHLMDYMFSGFSIAFILNRISD